VFIVGDDPQGLRFTVALDDSSHAGGDLAKFAAESAVAESDTGAEARRVYITTTFKARLHQRAFRERVLLAYRSQCALCRLRHEEFLDAAHIVPDAEEDGGEPVVPNGLSLCKLHHAAYDKQFLTVRPDYIIEVRQSLLDEEDGPMLLHGLKAMHGQRIALPRSQRQHPDPKRLERRYRLFKRTG
jgi:putative restriction endonuclease